MKLSLPVKMLCYNAREKYSNGIGQATNPEMEGLSQPVQTSYR